MKISGVFFCIVLLAFLMPFMVVKCGETKIASVSGLKLAFGGTYSSNYMNKLAESTQTLADMMPSVPGAEVTPEADTPKESKKEKLKPNFWALIAFLMGLGGLITSLILPKKSYLVPLAMSVVGILGLLFIKSGLKGGMDIPADAGAQIADMIKIQAQFGYYLAFLGFIGAGVLAFLSGRNSPYVSQENISRIIPERVETAFDKAKDTVSAAGASISDTVVDLVDKGKDIVENANLQEKLDSVVDKGKDLIEKGKDIFEKADLSDEYHDDQDKAETVIDNTEDAVETAKEDISDDEAK